MADLALEIRRHEHGPETVLLVSGDLDYQTAADLHAELADPALDGHRVVVDLSGVPFIDSAGLQELWRARKSLGQRSGQLVLTGVGAQPAELLRITRLAPMFTVRDGSHRCGGGRSVAGEDQRPSIHSGHDRC